MDLVMNTVVVAKYWGFLQARGVGASTIKKEVSNLNQSITLITSKHIPNTTKVSTRCIKDVQGWLSNVLYALEAQVKEFPSTKPPSNGTSIYELWECINDEINAWEKDFEVSGCVRMWGVDGCMPSLSH